MSPKMFLMVFFAFFLFSNPPTVFSANENPQAPKKNLYYLFNYRWFTTPKSQNTENVLHQLSTIDQEEGPNWIHFCHCKPTHPSGLASTMLFEDQPKRYRCPPCPHPPALAPSTIVPKEEDDILVVGPNKHRCSCKTRPYRCPCPHSPAPAPLTAMVLEEEDDILDEVPNKRRCKCPHHPPSVAPTMFLDDIVEEGSKKIPRCRRCPRHSPAPAPSVMLPEEEDDLNEVPNKHHCHCKPHHAPGLSPTMMPEDHEEEEPQKKKKKKHPCHCDRHHHHPPASAPSVMLPEEEDDLNEEVPNKHHCHCKPHHAPGLSPTMMLEDHEEEEPQKKKKKKHPCHCDRHHHHSPASAPHHHHPRHPPAKSPHHHHPRHPAPSPKEN